MFWVPDDAQGAPEPAGQAPGPGQPGHGQAYPPGQPGSAKAAAGGQPYAQGYPPSQAYPPGPPYSQAYPPGQPGYGQAYPPGQPGYGQPAGYPYRGAGRVNGFAIASFVLGLAGFMLVTLVLSVIFGIVALAGIRRTAERGKGLAIAGLVLSGVWVLLFALIIVIGATSSRSQSAAAGHVSHAVTATVSVHPASPGRSRPG